MASFFALSLFTEAAYARSKSLTCPKYDKTSQKCAMPDGREGNYFPSIRDQDNRGTCASFAVTGAVDYWARKNYNKVDEPEKKAEGDYYFDHSEQWLYWANKEMNTSKIGINSCQYDVLGRPNLSTIYLPLTNEGSNITEMINVLQEKGIPVEHAAWAEYDGRFSRDWQDHLQRFFEFPTDICRITQGCNTAKEALKCVKIKRQTTTGMETPLKHICPDLFDVTQKNNRTYIYCPRRLEADDKPSQYGLCNLNANIQKAPEKIQEKKAIKNEVIYEPVQEFCRPFFHITKRELYNMPLITHEHSRFRDPSFVRKPQNNCSGINAKRCIPKMNYKEHSYDIHLSVPSTMRSGLIQWIKKQIDDGYPVIATYNNIKPIAWDSERGRCFAETTDDGTINGNITKCITVKQPDVACISATTAGFNRLAEEEEQDLQPTKTQTKKLIADILIDKVYRTINLSANFDLTNASTNEWEILSDNLADMSSNWLLARGLRHGFELLEAVGIDTKREQRFMGYMMVYYHAQNEFEHPPIDSLGVWVREGHNNLLLKELKIGRILTPDVQLTPVIDPFSTKSISTYGTRERFIDSTDFMEKARLKEVATGPINNGVRIRFASEVIPDIVNQVRGLYLTYFFPPLIYNMSGKYGEENQEWGIYRYDPEKNMIYLFDSYEDYLEAEAFRVVGEIDVAVHGIGGLEEDSGAHAVLITGYNDSVKMFEYRNSKGDRFGKFVLWALDLKDVWTGDQGGSPPWEITYKYSMNNNCPSIKLRDIISAFPHFNKTGIGGAPFERPCDKMQTSFCGYGLMSYDFLQYSSTWEKDKANTWRRTPFYVIR